MSLSSNSNYPIQKEIEFANISSELRSRLRSVQHDETVSAAVAIGNGKDFTDKKRRFSDSFVAPSPSPTPSPSSTASPPPSPSGSSGSPSPLEPKRKTHTISPQRPPPSIPTPGFLVDFTHPSLSLQTSKVPPLTLSTPHQSLTPHKKPEPTRYVFLHENPQPAPNPTSTPLTSTSLPHPPSDKHLTDMSLQIYKLQEELKKLKNENMTRKWENDELKCENRRFKMFNEELTMTNNYLLEEKHKIKIAAEIQKEQLTMLQHENRYLRTVVGLQKTPLASTSTSSAPAVLEAPTTALSTLRNIPEGPQPSWTNNERRLKNAISNLIN